MNQGIVAVCSPALFDQAQGDPARWVPRNLIHIMGHENHWSKVRQALHLDEPAARIGPAVDTTIAALELAANGAGCALAHRIFLASYLRTGRLVLALEQEVADDNSYFVVMPERPQRMRREVQLFRDWLMRIAASEGVETSPP
jgi:LysR family glycine cleavage system transcriptional activator